MDNGTQTGIGDPSTLQPAQTPPTPAPAGQPQPPVPPNVQSTAPATATPQKPGSGSGFDSVMGGIVMGGLMGAARAGNKVAHTIGRGLSNLAYNSEVQQKARAQALAQREGEQRMQLAQKAEGRAESQETREQQKAMDEHQRNQLELSIMNTQQAGLLLGQKLTQQQLEES